MEDKIVKEVRDVRRKMEAEFNDDPQKYLNHVYEAQKKHGKRLVRRSPKLLKKHSVA